MGDGFDNAHNNAFSNGKNPGIGGVPGSGSGSSSGGSNGQKTPGPTGTYTGWCVWGTPSTTNGMLGPDGNPRIEISQGMQRCQIKVDVGASGNNNSSGFDSRGNFKKSNAWRPQPDDWNCIDNGFPYMSRSTGLPTQGLIVRVDSCVFEVMIEKNQAYVVRNVNQPLNDGDSRVNYLKSFQERKPAAEKIAMDYMDVKDAIYGVSLFYKETSNKFGDAFAKQAEALAEGAKGKKIRNAAEGIAAFNRYKDVLNKKFSVADREAVARALESMNKDQMAKQLKTFGKAFGIVGSVIDIGDMTSAMVKGLRTGDWGDAFRTGERLATTKLASAAVAFAYAALATTPLGIVGYALIMAVTSALIDDALMQRINNYVLSL